MLHEWTQMGMEGRRPQGLAFVHFLVREAASKGRVSARLSGADEIAFEIGPQVVLARAPGARGRLRSMCAHLACLFRTRELYGSYDVRTDLELDGSTRMFRLSFANSNAAGVWFEIVPLAMRTDVLDALFSELELRGYRDGKAPNGSMAFSKSLVARNSISALLIEMSVRNLKLRSSWLDFEPVSARESRDDVEIIISAIRHVIDTRLPAGPNLVDGIWRETSLRGFIDGVAPNRTTRFSRTRLAKQQISGVLMATVFRRQKIFEFAAQTREDSLWLRNQIADAELAVAAVAAALDHALANATT